MRCHQEYKRRGEWVRERKDKRQKTKDNLPSLMLRRTKKDKR
jgi:hypothetical protein